MALYVNKVEVAPDVPPVIASPSINFWFAEMKSLAVHEAALPSASTRTVAVALLVDPVIVSPISNFPVVPEPFSKTTLSLSDRDWETKVYRR